MPDIGKAPIKKAVHIVREMNEEDIRRYCAD